MPYPVAMRLGGGEAAAPVRRAERREHGPARGVVRAGSLVGLILGLGCLATPSRAGEPRGAEEPTIRVLLAESVRSLEVDAAGASPSLEIQADGSGLRMAGTRRQRIVFPAPGPHRVDGRRYRGAIEVEAESGGLRVVNEVPLAAYVAGTLLGEVPESWGETVLKAQAVATRTYALHRRARAGARAWDVEGDTRGQVYLGMDGESDASWRAVEATRDQVLLWDGELILAAFHGTAGGRTASAEEVWGRPVPYLESVPVDGEELSPDTYWRAPVGADELGRTLEAMGHPVGRAEHVEIARRTPSGRCETLEVRGTRDRAEVSAVALRRALGERRLRSTLFAVRRTPDGFVFVGSGRGHGVGMSQWGARAMAERGAHYRAILGRFYPGARVATIRGSATGRTAAGGSW